MRSHKEQAERATRDRQAIEVEFEKLRQQVTVLQTENGQLRQQLQAIANRVETGPL